MTSISEYAAQIEAAGTRICPGSSGAFWMSYERGSMMRMPTFVQEPPDSRELRRLFWHGALMACYLLSPSETHPPTVWWYVCADPLFRLERLCSTARRDIRRSQRCFDFRSVSLQETLLSGGPAFSDTRTRVGLSDGGRTSFTRRMERHFASPAHHAVGAWKGDELAAFATLVDVDDWVEVTGVFSANAHLRDCPNNGLIYHIQHSALVASGKRLVSYGLSSVQDETGEVGLHAFKIKAGFEARPVCRLFVLHPLLRPFAGRPVLGAVRLLQRIAPANRYLRKTAGSLGVILGMRKLSLQVGGGEEVKRTDGN